MDSPIIGIGETLQNLVASEIDLGWGLWLWLWLRFKINIKLVERESERSLGSLEQ